MTEQDIRRDMCLMARSLFERGLTPGSSGNLSARLPEGGFLVTPTNASLGFLDPDMLSRLADDGTWIAGDKPTKETFLHLAMYRGRPAFQAVVHLHSTYCVCLSCLTDRDPKDLLPPLTPYVRMRAGAVASVPYVRPGDPSIAPLIEETARSRAAIIIQNHGPVVGGQSLRDAVYAIEELEEAAKIDILLSGHKTRKLSPRDLRDLDEISLLPAQTGGGTG